VYTLSAGEKGYTRGAGKFLQERRIGRQDPISSTDLNLALTVQQRYPSNIEDGQGLVAANSLASREAK
jgi:hypothetical protein